METPANPQTGPTEESSEPLLDLVEVAQALLAGTAHVPEEKVVAARQRLMTAIANGQKTWRQVQATAVAGARATDKVIRNYPYKALGIALGVGAITGYLLRRRS